MVRNIIKIDEEKCNGCGLCAAACHEGAIVMAEGKARLIRDDYCDGLGNCLPVCPTGAISFEEREAAAYDEAAVQRRQAQAAPAPQETSAQAANAAQNPQKPPLACGCPGTNARRIVRATPQAQPARMEPQDAAGNQSELSQWPVQIKLVPPRAPYFDKAHLLIAADCTAYAYGDFHRRFLRGRILLIGCPKLDSGDYGEKLTASLRDNDLRSVTVLRMDVPCCGGLEMAAKTALKNCGKLIPWQVHTVGVDGQLCDE